MKRLLLILILTFSFQSWTKADDISDFQIEGMSIGDSLLDHMSKSEIKETIKLTKNHYKYLKHPRKYREAYIFQPNDFKNYEKASLMFKENDKNYKIFFIRGMKDYNENLSGCLSKISEIEKDVETSIPNHTKKFNKFKAKLDKSGKSMYHNTYYTLSSGDEIVLSCNNWEEKLRKKNNWSEGLSVIIQTKEFAFWLAEHN
jgi:hypothetical protein